MHIFIFFLQMIRTFASWLPKVNRLFFTEPAKADEFSRLPEDCIAKIISFTSPKDACTAAAVSPAFKSAAEYDAVWEHFLPPDYKEIISGSDVAFSTKKELYFLLCDSALLVDGGKMSFKLNSRYAGKKCYMLSARELDIAWINNPTHWQWTSKTESRFGEVAELRSVCWLEIRGTLRSQTLSANTNYAAFLVYKLAMERHGLEGPSKASINKFVKDSTTKKTEGDDVKTVSIAPPRMIMPRRPGAPRIPRINPKYWRLSIREDGWYEIELGEFFVDEGDECDVQIQLHETESHWKRGLIVEGIEVRPKETF